MSLPTFFASSLSKDSTEVSLNEPELQHARAARRLGHGDQVCVLNGCGVSAVGIITTLDRNQFKVSRLQITVHAALVQNIVIAVAIPKADRQRFLIESLTQLGVSQIVPLNCDLSAAKFANANAKGLVKWRRYAIEACKQSQNPWLPSISEGQSVAQIVDQFKAGQGIIRRLLADGAGTSVYVDTQAAKIEQAETVLVTIGPEGGFSDRERLLLRDNCYRPTRIGNTILRIETAAIAFASVISSLTSSVSDQ